MVKQISLDTWSTDRLNELLKKGTNIVTQTNLPIVLYRETLCLLYTSDAADE